MQIAEACQAVVHRHHHDVAELCKLRAVVSRTVTGTGREAAAVERHHHRALLAVIDAGSPDVEGETIFSHAADVLIPLDHHAVVAAQVRERLRADLSMAETLANAGP